MAGNWLDRAWTEVEGGLARTFGYVPRRTVDAIVDVAALVAVADGTRDEPTQRSERLELLTLLRQLGRLRSGQLRSAGERFHRTAEALKTEGGETRRMILARIREMADTPDEARLIMRMAHEVATADGDEDAAEDAVLRELGEALGVDPTCCRPFD